MEQKWNCIGKGRTAEIFLYHNRAYKRFFSDFQNAKPREAQVMAQLQQYALPMPMFFGVETIDGAEYLVYAYVNGKTMLQLLVSHPLRVRKYGKKLALLHYEIHQVKDPALPAEKARIQKAISTAPLRPAQKEKALEALTLLPSGASLCHMDFHPDNIMMDEPGNDYVIDWTGATQGHPLFDVARTLLLFQAGSVPPDTPFAKRILMQLFRKILARIYEKTYYKLSSYTKEDLRPFFLPAAAARYSEQIEEEKPFYKKFFQQI